MRPVDKGAIPVDAAGNAIAVTQYDKWRRHLIDRIGAFCSYCNMPLSHSLQVEHISPKNPPPGYTAGAPLAWDNMLLACGPCNRAKSNTPINFDNYYFPDQDNTLMPFTAAISPLHPESAIVAPSPALTVNQNTRAVNTINLMDLDNIDQRDDIVDIRHLKRRTAINAVELAYQYYQGAKAKSTAAQLLDLAELVATIAAGYGFFGLWFRKFESEKPVMEALVSHPDIPGTAISCFDHAHDYKIIGRNPAKADPI